jgi:putative transposase
LPEREIMTGIGPVGVRAPRVRDRADPLLIGDSAALCAPIEEPRGVDPGPLPEGLSTGDFEEALAALLGKDAGGLSASEAF